MNIRQAKKKIRSVTSVRKITKAMQLVSAIKMKKAQQVALEGKLYQDQLEIIIKKVVGKMDMDYSQLLSEPKAITSSSKSLAIVISTNKGLCGGFNMNLFRFIVKNADFKSTDFVIMGKKAGSLGKFGAKIIADYSSTTPLENVSALFNLTLKNFLSGSYREIILFYSKFISTLRTEPTKVVLLPFALPNSTKTYDQEEKNEYLIEPNPMEIINPLLNSYVEGKIRDSILQTEAGEHSSRMVAMKNATENANDVIYNLTMLRNKLRQEKITNELLDMVTAKESVESS